MAGHRVQPSVGNASSLFGSDGQDDFFGSRQPQESPKGGLKMNPFDAIGEEVEISESDEHLFAPASSSSSTEPNYSHTDQGKNTSQTANQASRYTPAPSAVSTDYPSHSHLPPQPQTTASPFGSPRNTSPSPYAPPQSQSARASPYGVSYSNTAASVQRPGSSILRKQVDAYDPPMPPPSRPITRNKSSLLLHQQQQPHAHSRPNSPYTPYNPSSQTMPPPPRRDSGQSSTNQADDSYNQRPYSPPIHARPASRGSQARSSLAQSQGQPAYQPVSRPSSRGATFNAYAPPPRAPSLPPGPPPATSSPYAPPPPRQQVPQSAPANQTQYAPNQYSQLPATSTPRSAQSPPLSNQYSPPAQPVYQQILHESPPSHRDHEPTTPNLSIHPASPAKPIHPPLPQSISATLAQTTPPMQQEGFASFPNLAFSPHGEDPENHQNRDEDWSYPSHRSPESTSTAGSAGDDWATHSPDSSRRPASSIDVRSPDELAVHDQPPLRRNVSEVNVGWTPELASQSSFQPLQPLGSPPISPNASFSGTPFGALSSPPQPPHRHSPAPPFASPAQAPPPSLQSSSVVTSPISPSTVPPAPTRQASSGAFDYKPSSSMTGLADTSIDSSAADRDPAIRAPYPVAAFGFGGKLFTSFPSPANNGFYGERGVAVKIQDLHDVIPDSTLEEFPGPLFSPKSSAAKLKEDVMHWLHTRVEAAEKEKGYSKSLGREAQTQSASDHCTLLRILTILIQHDGKLIGSSEAEQSALRILSPQEPATFSTVGQLQSLQRPEQPISTAELRPSDLDEIQRLLLQGQRKEAVQYAMERRLWAHAFVLASSIDRDSWQATVERFVRAEIDSQGDRPSLRMIYGLFSGRSASAVDALLPASSDAPSIPTSVAPSVPLSRAQSPGTRPATPERARYAQALPESLDQWQDTAAMIFANPTTGSSAALTRLGDVLAANSRYLAAHACYLLSPSTSPIGTAPGGRIVLLGQASPLADPSTPIEIESILLTEIFEYAMSLVPVPKGQDPFTGFPYLHAYRLVHASLATDSGHLHVAQKYCDSIGAALKMSAKMSPFYHPTLLKHTKSLLDRVSGSPSKAEGGSWVSRKIPQRPTLDTLWSTLEGRFTSFVAGESESKESPKKLTPNTVGEAGPFAQFSTIGPQDEPQAATSIAPEKPQSHPNLRKASESFQPPVPPMPPGPPPPMPAFQPSAPPASSRAAPLPPGPPPPSLPKAKPPLSAAKKGHSHKRSQSMGFLAYGSDPYASAPSWAPPPAPQAFPEQDEEETENMATAQPDQQNEAPSNGWWSAAGYSEPSEARDDTADASTDNFISPMGSTSASPAPLAQPPSQPTITEEEDLEDLGFGNASSHKRKQEKSQLNATENSAPTPAPTSEPAVPETKPTEQPSLRSSGSAWSLGRLFRRDSGTPGPVKAKLGDETSFVYDKELKKWVNKKAGDVSSTPGTATPPPPRAQTASPAGFAPAPRPASAAPPLTSSTMPPPLMKSASSTGAPKASSASGTPPLPSTAMPSSRGDAEPPPPAPKRPGMGKKPTRNKYIVVD